MKKIQRFEDYLSSETEIFASYKHLKNMDTKLLQSGLLFP
jgi:hypothetical protein